jgi:hypothetical protein
MRLQESGVMNVGKYSLPHAKEDSPSRKPVSLGEVPTAECVIVPSVL